MANKSLFQSIIGRWIPPTDAVNEAGGVAYAFDAEHALAQYAVTGCLNHTFYATDRNQLDTLLRLAAGVDPEFLARLALFSRERAFMKDTPALLCAILSVRGPDLLEAIFERVIDTGRMVRTFVQIMRSGTVGRKSLGSRPKRLVRRWLANRSDAGLLHAAVGCNPSLVDVIKMVHPRPDTLQRAALYGYLLGRPVDGPALPQVVRDYEDFKHGRSPTVPNVPFQMLTSLKLDTAAWCAIARQASWHMTRMNLNTFARHGVLDRPDMVELIANRLGNVEAIRRARVFPYQLLAAYHAAADGMPWPIREGLHDALEVAVDNVPSVAGRVCVCPDVSGSMHAAVTGFRRGATTAVRCIDVAALVTAAVLRRNPETEIVPFNHEVVPIRLSARDTVMTNARMLSRLPHGGTKSSAALHHLNRHGVLADLVIYVSDNQSWVDTRMKHAPASGGTETMREWNVFKRRNRRARLVCIDVQPYRTTQAVERDDILNIGGFSDQVFDVVADFAGGRLDGQGWLRHIQDTPV